MRVYAGEFDVERKDDNSPLTAADLAAHHVHRRRPRAARRRRFRCCRRNRAEQCRGACAAHWSRYWLVDPLDGTREFVKRNGEFTVNIALIEDGSAGARRGVCAGDRRDVLRPGAAALAQFAQGRRRGDLRTRPRGDAPLIVAGSRSHADPRMQTALAGSGAHEMYRSARR